MNGHVWQQRGRARVVLALSIVASLAASPTAVAAPHLTAIAPATGSFDQEVKFVRTADGTLHLVYITNPGTGADDGFQSRTISPQGTVGPAVQALSGWQMQIPGLTRLSNGELLAVFGALPPSPYVSGAYESESTDGGQTWSAPTLAGSGSTLEGQIYGSVIDPFEVGSTPVLTVDTSGITVQSGLGNGSPTSQVPLDSTDNFVGELSTAQDAATGEIIASWQSEATPGGDFVAGVWPVVQTPTLVPGQRRNWLVLSARDTGPGVFGAFTPDGSHVRVFRYGRAGSVAVGALRGVSPESIGTAIGFDGRIWVMWGDTSSDPKIAFTRSNRADTRFEPIQTIDTDAFSLTRIVGDGRLGPLDLLVDEEQVHAAHNEIYYTRVLPELSGSVFSSPVSGKPDKFKLTAKVNDAGDAVSGASVRAKGVAAKTNSSGVAELIVTGTAGDADTVTVRDPGYNALIRHVAL